MAEEPSMKQRLAEVEKAALRGRRLLLVQAALMGCHDVLAFLLLPPSDGDGPAPTTESDFLPQERTAAFLAAALEGHKECMRVMLEAWPESAAQLVAATGRVGWGWTPLMSTASSGHESCVDLLLQHSPDTQVAYRTSSGMDALTCATLNGRVNVLRRLLQYSPQLQQLDQALAAALKGAQARAQRDSGGEIPTPRERFHRCVELLLSKGAMLTPQSPPEAFAELRPIVQDLAARTLVPDMANEAAAQAMREIQKLEAQVRGRSRARLPVTPAELTAVAGRLEAVEV